MRNLELRNQLGDIVYEKARYALQRLCTMMGNEAEDSLEPCFWADIEQAVRVVGEGPVDRWFDDIKREYQVFRPGHLFRRCAEGGA